MNYNFTTDWEMIDVGDDATIEESLQGNDTVIFHHPLQAELALELVSKLKTDDQIFLAPCPDCPAGIMVGVDVQNSVVVIVVRDSLMKIRSAGSAYTHTYDLGVDDRVEEDFVAERYTLESRVKLPRAIFEHSPNMRLGILVGPGTFKNAMQFPPLAWLLCQDVGEIGTVSHVTVPEGHAFVFDVQTRQCLMTFNIAELASTIRRAHQDQGGSDETSKD